MLPGGAPVYVATPYSLRVRRNGGWDRTASYDAWIDATIALRRLLSVGVTGVSPIVMAGSMIHVGDHIKGMAVDPFDDDLWAAWCRPLMMMSCAIWVPEIPGWRDSRGIAAEVGWAKDNLMRVFVEAAA